MKYADFLAFLQTNPDRFPLSLQLSESATLRTLLRQLFDAALNTKKPNSVYSLTVGDEDIELANPVVFMEVSERFDVVILQKRAIGLGGTATVYKGISFNLSAEIVVKRYFNYEGMNSALIEASIDAERTALSILRLTYGDATISGAVYMTQLLVRGATLQDYMYSLQALRLGVRDSSKAIEVMIRTLRIFVATIEAVRKIHERRIIHRDLKPENIMYRFLNGGRVEIRIIDFGSSLKLPQGNEQMISTMFFGTRRFSRDLPESDQFIYSRESDYHSIQVIFSELWSLLEITPAVRVFKMRNPKLIDSIKSCLQAEWTEKNIDQMVNSFTIALAGLVSTDRVVLNTSKRKERQVVPVVSECKKQILENTVRVPGQDMPNKYKPK